MNVDGTDLEKMRKLDTDGIYTVPIPRFEAVSDADDRELLRLNMNVLASMDDEAMMWLL